MADDISSDEREEIAELASDEDDAPLKTKVIGNDGRDERVSSSVRNTSVSTGSEKRDNDAQENGEVEDSEEEEDEEDDESEDESDEESSSGDSYSEDSEEFERYKIIFFSYFI